MMITRSEIFPLLGHKRKREDYVPVDLSRQYLKQIGINTSTGVKAYVDNSTKQGAMIAYGGYGEQRPLYDDSGLYQTESAKRDVHLGIDLWHTAGAPVYSPLDGVLHSRANNNIKADYGYTIIVAHEHPVIGKFHILYGHLSSDGHTDWQVNDPVPRGAIIGTIGNLTENGGWSPHLHFQMIIDMEGKQGDYPGVCEEERRPHYFNNCPDPMLLIRLGD